MKEKKKPTRRAAAAFSEEERQAMREHVREARVASGRSAAPPDAESEVLAKIAEMPAKDREIAERVHALVKGTAPHLTSRTWYGMPAYAKDGKVLCFFQPASKFKTRYGTFGFNDAAHLDDGGMWPVAFAVHDFGAAEERQLRELVKRAAG